MQKKCLTIRGKEVYFLDDGLINAPAVLFLHGFPESSLLWGEIVTSVQKAGYRAIAPDLPGFGQSEAFNEPSTWERYMEFISDFIEELSLEQFHLVTHDWGSLIGSRWACSNPELVRSLIIADATYSPDFVWHKDALIMRSLGGGEQFIEYLKNKSVFEGFIKKSIPNISQAIVEDFYKLFSDPTRIKIALELYRSGDMDKLEVYRGRLAEFLSMPVSIIFGEHDSYILPEYGRKLKEEELHHAYFHIIPGAGHFTPLEAPNEFVAILTKHLKSV